MTSVRTAVFPDDHATVSALVGAYLRRTEAEKAERGLVAEGAPLAERYAREIADPATAFAGRRVLLAEVGSIAAGIVVVAASRTGTEISRLWTARSVRGRGVGRALVDAALEHAPRPVRLSVWRWREPAIALYRRCGFHVAPSWDDRPDLLCLERSA